MVNNLTRKAIMCAFPAFVIAGSANALDVKVSGYVKLDATYDTDQRQGDFTYAATLSTGDEGDTKEGGFNMHARESRIKFTASGNGYTAVIEGDFFGAAGGENVSNSNGLRQRLAFVKTGNWLFGQSWSNFMDFMTWPTTLDFAGSPGVSFIRQAQIRYTNAGFSAALENPEARIVDATNTSLTSVDPLPDVTFKYRSDGDHMGFHASTVIRSIEADLGADTESVTAIGAQAGIVFKTDSGGKFGLKVIAGEPGRYQQEKFFFPDVILIDGDLEVIESTSFQLSYGQTLSNGSFNLGYGQLDIDDEFEAQVATVGGFETVSEFHINRIWNVGKNMQYGIEVGYGEREDFSGDDGDNTRVQFSAKYSF
ncbi:MAG: DcaP family trimeric outer membrane transporter [Cellvibrionaceae bacterium]